MSNGRGQTNRQTDGHDYVVVIVYKQIDRQSNLILPSIYMYIQKGWYGSRCSFSVLLRWVNAIKVWANAIKGWANAIKIQDQHKKSANLVLGNWKFKIIETKYEYFKHFAGLKNPFFVFVLIWYFNSIISHFNSNSSS